MRRTLFIALAVIVLVTGLPGMMSMGDTAACDSCGPGVLLPLMCLAALAAGAAVLLPELLRTRLHAREPALSLALFAEFFERPPQPV